MDEILLDETEFDVIVLGTGIAESMLSASLAGQGKSVLHLDSNTYYGTNNTTLSLSALEELGAMSADGAAVTAESGCLPAYDGVPVLTDFSLDLYQPPIPDPSPEESTTAAEKEAEAKEAEAAETKEAETAEAEGEKGEGEEGVTTETKLDAEASEQVVEPASAPETVAEEREEEEVDERTAEEKLHAELLAVARSFNIDLYPTGLLSNGRTVELLVNSHVHHYLEFKCFENSYIATGDSLQQVPCSKTAVFKSSFITLSEKRQLMRFVSAYVQSDAVDDAEKQAELATTPLIELLESRRMSKKLQDIILYAIVQADSDQSVPENQIKAKEGLERMKRYMTSLGKYGETPLLYSLFGCSEIPQAFSRNSAVKGTIFVLRRGAKHFLVDEATGNVTGIHCTAGQTLTAKHVICSQNYTLPRSCLKPLAADKSGRSHSRAVIVTDKSVVEGGKHLIVTVPGKIPVTAHQLDPSLSTVPKDKFLVQLVAKASGAGPKADLEEAVKQLFNVSNGGDDSKPAALYQAYFHLARYGDDERELPANLFVCGQAPEVGIELDFASVVAEAETIFHKICGDDLEFFAKTPDPLRDVPEKDAADELIEYAETIDKKEEEVVETESPEKEDTTEGAVVADTEDGGEKKSLPALRQPPAPRAPLEEKEEEAPASTE